MTSGLASIRTEHSMRVPSLIELVTAWAVSSHH